MSAFFRLHPQLQHAIVHDLGWRALRPVQELATDAILDGANAVVLAPTAGGKTEASVFPVLSRVLAEGLRPVAALYVCPIRALLNNQEQRLQQYARMVGLNAFKWHGDVAASTKNRFRRDPAHLLLTTPESLEVMLISERTDARALFGGLSAIIVDEVHAFAGDDRGAHLVSVLERLTRFCGRDIQRIGLSATVGNPDAIGRWLQGSSKRELRLVDPPKSPAERDLHVELLDDPGLVAAAAAKIGAGKKSLVFVESRGQAERIAGAMQGRGVDVFVHHSAVSRADRELAERRFVEGRNTAIVCTSTMELGIDVGDLDLVVQVDAPGTLASLLQRMGRTGRREGTRSNCTLLCQSAESLLQATALMRLLEAGKVEDVRPVRRAFHVLAHQILALTLQEQGISRHQILDWVASATPFSGVTASEVNHLVDTMVARQILHEADGLLSLGAEGERQYGRKNFFELYAVFTAPQVLRVMHGADEVGTVQGTFLTAARDGEARMVFRLAGRSWQVVEVDWARGTCKVAPAEGGRVPAWLGAPTGLSFRLCQEMKAVLRQERADEWLTPAARGELARMRGDYDGLVEEGATALEQQDGGVRWHTFAGAATNRLLALALSTTGMEWTPGNLSLKTKGDVSVVACREVLDRLRDIDWQEMARAQAPIGPVRAVSKFQRCMPEDLERALLVERLYDIEGAEAVAKAFRKIIAG